MPKERILIRSATLQIFNRMIWFIALFSLAMIAVDCMAVKRLFGDRNRKRRTAITICVLAADLLPFLSMAAVFLFSRDNTTGVMMFSAWMFYLYMITAVSRLPFNLAAALSRNGAVRVLGATVSLVMVGMFVYGMAVTRTDYEVKRVTIESDHLPAAFDGYAIAVISDIHIGTMLRPQRELTRLAELCNSLHPDMVAFCGDLVNIRYTEIDEPIARALTLFSAPDGVFSVIGNHDTGCYIRDSLSLTPEENTARLIEKETEAGWRVLDDRTDYIRRGADSIAVTGISFSRGLKDNRHSQHIPAAEIDGIYASVPDSLFDITLAHIPQLWTPILEKRLADLTLSGHVHAMQMKFPAGERGVSPARLVYPRWSGLYEEDGRALYVNDGIGCVLYPMRIGARPEITLITLKYRIMPQK